MLRKCTCLGITITILAAGFLMQNLLFLKSYAPLSFYLSQYGIGMLVGLLVVFANVTFVSYSILRPLSMSSTGRKLEHMDRGLSAGNPVMGELAERLERQ